MRSEHYQLLLKKYWGYDDFRGIQREIIESIMAGRDTLGLMPTGGGKSITFQVPALAQEGVCIVITPLIALMKDQVQNLRKRGIKAAAIHSGLSHDELLITLDNAVFGAVKLLYVSPERLTSDIFLTKLQHMRVSFICVDEAHCISQWGYDFRPSYLQIAEIRRLLPDAPVLALTATATPAVVSDIQQRLAFKQENVFRMSFERKNLAYVVRHAEDKFDELLHILNNLKGSAIVYARSRERTKEFAELLCKAGLQATYFHAGLDNAVKDQRQRDWQADKVRIMVATNAFGMGIDKPDVRIVAHIDCPSSIEAYFQEAGRAGRDGQKAYAVLLYNPSDQHKLEKRINDTFPPLDYVRQVYEHLAYFYQVGVGSGYNAIFEFNIELFCKTYHHFPIQVVSALKILNRAGYIDFTEEEDNQARVKFILERDDLYRLKENSPNEERLITALLRNYSGLFNDYRYIDEAYLAQLIGVSRPQVYMLLKGLSQKRIINFIPQKRTPYVRYMQRREEQEHLHFPKEVYDDLRTRFSERIKAMIDYATSEGICRSRLLLDYFGETRTKDCGQCDVCVSLKNNQKQVDLAAEAILQLLSDGKERPITALRSINMPYEYIDEALNELQMEERIAVVDGYISLN